MNHLLSSVNLFVIDLEDSPAELARCRSLLSAGETARAARFHRADAAKRWIVCRARLREILAAACELEPASLVFGSEHNGKPVIRLAGAATPLHFNLSHSHRRAVVATTLSGPVGVDIEFVKPLRDLPGVAARFFSPAEQAELGRVPPALAVEAFFNGWTRKEAVIKTTGEGLSARLDGFDVTLQPGAPARVVGDRIDRGDSLPWRMHHFVPETGYIGAVALRSAHSVTWHPPEYWPARPGPETQE